MTETRKAVLLLTNSEHGQANVMFAVAYEFLIRNEFDIHIATFSDAGPRVSLFNETFAARHSQGHFNLNDKSCIETKEAVTGKAVDTAPVLTFHPISGRSMSAALASKPEYILEHGVGNIRTTLKAYQTLIDVVFYWTPDEYIKAYESCAEIIRTVRPSFTVCDPLFYVGQDAVNNSQIPCAVLSPTCLKDTVLAIQPYGAVFWKYPASCTGYPFPLPWYRIPANVCIIISAVYILLRERKIAAINKKRLENGIFGRMPSKRYSTDQLYLCPSLPETEYPLHVPSNVIGCGPIVLPSVPLSDTDRELGDWLARKPTVLICLGTHFKSDSSFAIEMAKGVVAVMEQRPDMQVLWKLKGAGGKSIEFHNVLGSRIASDQVRVTEWLIPDMMSIFDSGNIVSFVNHGGGNSYNEGCRAGIPQVILPAWYDTYEFADRAKRFGFGVWGNEGVVPGIRAMQFGDALLRTLTDQNMIAKARAIGELCRESGGRELACEMISRLARVA